MQRVAPPGLRQSLRSVFAYRLEEPVPRLPVSRPRDDERRLDEPAHELVGAREVDVRAHRANRLQCEAACEDREGSQQLTLVSLEQRVAPVDRRPERLVAWHGRPPRRAEEAETIAETVGDVSDGERFGPRGGECD